MPPKIIKEKCNGCGICIYQCGGFCLAIDQDTARVKVINARGCVDCFQCEATCPEEAISIMVAPERKKGKSP